MEALAIRKIADKSDGERVARFHPETGQRFLADPNTGEHKPWPLLGIAPVTDNGEPSEWPKQTRVPTSTVLRGKVEGWIELSNEQVVHRPGGPPEDEWRVTHTFIHADKIIFKSPPGTRNAVYEVTHQPDKYAVDGPANKKVTPELYSAGETRIDWFYELRLAN